MAETTFKGVQFSPTQRFNTSYVLEEYVKMVDKKEYWWKFVGYYSHPSKWLPEINNIVSMAHAKFKVRLGNLTTFQVFVDKYQISKEPISLTSGGGQYFVKPNDYCMTLGLAMWHVVEDIIKEKITGTITAEEYIELIVEAFKLFETCEISPTIKKVVKESAESADNIQ
jgi:hypothetical protein